MSRLHLPSVLAAASLLSFALRASAQDCEIPTATIPFDKYCTSDGDCGANQTCAQVIELPFLNWLGDSSRRMCTDFSAGVGEDCDMAAYRYNDQGGSTAGRLPSPGCAQSAGLECQATEFTENPFTEVGWTCVQTSVGIGESCPLGRNGRPGCAVPRGEDPDFSRSLFCKAPAGAVSLPGPGPGGIGGGFEGNGTCFELVREVGAKCGDVIFSQCDNFGNGPPITCQNGACAA